MSLIDQMAAGKLPWHLVPVVDNSMWTADGEGYIRVQLGDEQPLTVYRDGRQPLVGELVQVRRFNGRRDSYLLALPLPDTVVIPCASLHKQFLVSAYSLTDGGWVVLHCDINMGTVTWTVRSAHPVPSGDYRPMWVAYISESALSQRVFTYSPGTALYYSDDDGFTWSEATGSSGITYAPFNMGPSDSVAPFAVACTATSILETYDQGASWTSIYGADPAGGSWRYVASAYKTVSASNAPGGTIPASEWGLIKAEYMLISDVGVSMSVNKFAHYWFPDEDPYGFLDVTTGSYVDGDSDVRSGPTGAVVIYNHPNIYGYNPIPGGLSAGRHAFRPTTDNPLTVLIQANSDNYSDAFAGGETAGQGFWEYDRDSIVVDWRFGGRNTYTAHTVASSTGDDSPYVVHPSAGGESDTSQNALIADLPSGDGYILHGYEGRFGGDNWYYMYENSRNHPTGRSGVGTRGVAYDFDCIVVGLSEDNAAYPQIVLGAWAITYETVVDHSSPPNYNPNTFTDISSFMLTQLGVKYAASYAGIAGFLL